MVAKGEIACNMQSFPLLQCFQNSSAGEAISLFAIMFSKFIAADAWNVLKTTDSENVSCYQELNSFRLIDWD